MRMPRILTDCRLQRGVALLNALVIISVAAGVATRLLRDDVDAYARFEMMVRSDQARQYALAAEWLARELLRADGENGETDHLGESWAQTERVFSVESGLVGVRVVDLQGRFNLNSIVGPDGVLRRPAYDQLDRMLDAAGAPSGTAVAVAEWMLSETPPQPMAGGSELRLIAGMTASVYRRLRPLVTALPVPTEINVNTSPVPVLKALAPNMDDDFVEEILESRAESPFGGPAEFRQRMAERVPPTVAKVLENTPVTVSSNWFLVDAEAHVETGRARVVTVIQRSPGGGVSALMRLEERP